MQHDLKWLFTAPYSKGELEKDIEMAEEIVRTQDTAYPDYSFEDGYIAALNFVLGNEQSSMREEFDALIAEGKLDGQTP
ncbi:hypothetical protein PQI64_12735 [Shewanella bicestrii]